MMKKLLASAVCAAVLAAAPAMAENLAVEAYGGARLSSTLDFDGSDYDMDSGVMYGVAFYYAPEEFAENWEFGLDFSASSADYSCCTTDLSSTALMVVGRYVLPVGNEFSLYGGLGLGWIGVSYGYGGSSDTGSGFGGQAAIGARFDITEDIAVFGEFRHQTAFGDVTLDDSYDVEYNSTNILAGLRINF